MVCILSPVGWFKAGERYAFQLPIAIQVLRWIYWKVDVSLFWLRVLKVSGFFDEAFKEGIEMIAENFMRRLRNI